jgi:hypothetical protein
MPWPIVAFYKQFELFLKNVIHKKNGPLGNVEVYWIRYEYQARGVIHAHLLVWCEEDTIPSRVISAEMPRTNHTLNDVFRDYVSAYQVHECRAERCYRLNKGEYCKNCKYGFPYQKQDSDKLDHNGIRYNYVRREDEDLRIVPYNLELLMLWEGHLNVQKATANGWEQYLAKYIYKCS